VDLEHELDLAKMEIRVQSGYISNLRVYESVVNHYVLRLREQLQRFEPGCRLLEYRIPPFPPREDHQIDGLELLSDAVTGMSI
jgi:hypothetical protein